MFLRDWGSAKCLVPLGGCEPALNTPGSPEGNTEGPGSASSVEKQWRCLNPPLASRAGQGGMGCIA